MDAVAEAYSNPLNRSATGEAHRAAPTPEGPEAPDELPTQRRAAGQRAVGVFRVAGGEANRGRHG